MTDIYEEISSKIYLIRNARGLSQEKLAEMVHMDQPMISKLENDRRYINDINKIILIANALNIDFRDFISLNESELMTKYHIIFSNKRRNKKNMKKKAINSDYDHLYEKVRNSIDKFQKGKAENSGYKLIYDENNLHTERIIYISYQEILKKHENGEDVWYIDDWEEIKYKAEIEKKEIAKLLKNGVITTENEYYLNDKLNDREYAFVDKDELDCVAKFISEQKFDTTNYHLTAVYANDFDNITFEFDDITDDSIMFLISCYEDGTCKIYGLSPEPIEEEFDSNGETEFTVHDMIEVDSISQAIYPIRFEALPS